MEFIGIYARPNDGYAIEVAYKVYRLLRCKYGVEVRVDRSLSHVMKEVDYFDLRIEVPPKLIVIGGDGTLLRAALMLQHADQPVIHAIRVGRRGFFFELDPSEGVRRLEDFLADNYWVEELPRLDAKVCREGACMRIGLAVNDVVVAAVGTKTLTISVTVDDEYVTDIEGDGVIVSTPIGSTAYSLSAGGPVVDKRVRVIVVTPLNPLRPTPPLVVDGHSEVKVLVTRCSEYVRVILDGQKVVRVNKGTAVQATLTGPPLRLARYGRSRRWLRLRSP